MKRIVGFSLVAMLFATPALAQRIEDGEVSVGRGGQSWSVLSGRLVTGDALHAQFGWPGLSVGYLHNASQKLDAGVRFTFNYGFEGVTRVLPGLKLQGLVRLGMIDSGKLNLALNFSPGGLVYFYNGGTAFGLTFPVGVVAGIPVGDALMLNFGMDVPFNVYFNPGGGAFNMHILFGGGLEYAIDRNMAFTLNTRFGPAISLNSGAGEFAFDALMGIAFKL